MPIFHYHIVAEYVFQKNSPKTIDSMHSKSNAIKETKVVKIVPRVNNLEREYETFRKEQSFFQK